MRPANPPPPPRPTKKKQENEDLTRAMISFMAQDEKEEKEQDEIDLALSAVGIRLKKSLTEEQIENAMDEINSIVTKHIKSARAKRFGIFKPSTSSEVVQQHHQQQHFASCTNWSANATTSTAAEHGSCSTTILMRGH